MGSFGGRNAFDDHAHVLENVIQAFSLTEHDAGTAVAAVLRRAGNEQIADAGEPKEGVRLCAEGDAKAGDLSEATGHERSAGVVAVAEPDGHTDGKGDDVLERAAELNTDDVFAGVDANVVVHENGLHALCCFLIAAGCDEGSRHIAAKFLGVAWPVEDNVTIENRFAENVGVNLVDTFSGGGFNALGDIDEHALCAGEFVAMRCQKSALALGWNADEEIVERFWLWPVAGDRKRRMQRHTRQIFFIFTAFGNLLHLLFVASPEGDAVAIEGEHLSQRCAPAAGAVYCYFCHFGQLLF